MLSCMIFYLFWHAVDLLLLDCMRLVVHFAGCHCYIDCPISIRGSAKRGVPLVSVEHSPLARFRGSIGSIMHTGPLNNGQTPQAIGKLCFSECNRKL